MNLFLLCVNQNDERSVLPMSSGDASAFLRERMGSWLCFSPSAVISLKRSSGVKGAMSDRLCLYSPGFRGIWSYWKTGDGWQLGDVCVMPIRRTPAVPLCVCVHACVQPRGLWGRGHGLHVLKYMLFLWPIISAHTWHLSQIDFIQL